MFVSLPSVSVAAFGFLSLGALLLYPVLTSPQMDFRVVRLMAPICLCGNSQQDPNCPGKDYNDAECDSVFFRKASLALCSIFLLSIVFLLCYPNPKSFKEEPSLLNIR